MPLSSEASAPLEETACYKKAEAAPEATLLDIEAKLKIKPSEPLQICRAYALFRSGQYEAASEAYAALAKKTSKGQTRRAAAFDEKAALAAMRLGDHQKAEIYFAASLRLDPSNAEVWLDRAMDRASAQRYWDAIDDLQQALNLKPDHIEALRLRAAVWLELGQETKAAEDASRVVELEKSRP